VIVMKRIALSLAALFLLFAFPALAFAASLPDATDPAASSSFVWQLYKAGHLIPAIIVALYFALTFAQGKIAWLRTGARKVYVAAALAGLTMLAERVASGTTPNFGMLAGAVGAAFTMWLKTHGEPETPTEAG
jgi:hypothetical protein